MTAPAGILMLPQEYLRVTLADSATFRTWVGAATQAAALAKIHHEALPPGAGPEHTLAELQAARPCVIVWTRPEDGFTRIMDAVNPPNQYSQVGSLMARFLDDVTASQGEAEIAIQFKNRLGVVLDEMGELAGLPGYLNIIRMSLVLGPWRTPPGEALRQGEYIGADVRFDWMD